MFTKVLASDDLGSVNKGVFSVVTDLGFTNIQQVMYCDDAYLKIKKASLDKEPFQLFISDLSFIADHREQTFKSGEALIKALKIEFPELKIIVYSIEDRIQRVRSLMQNDKIDAYVCKGRRGLLELAQAVNAVYNNQTYLSPQVAHALSPKIDLEIDDYDIELVRQLSKGFSQEDISELFKSKNISPNSLSSVEKRLNRLRTQFKANNAIHLVAITKDLGLI